MCKLLKILIQYFFFYFWGAGGLVSICWSFTFSTHPPYSKPPPFFLQPSLLAFWIFQIPRGNDVRRKGEWTDGKRAKGKSNVSGMAEGMKVTYWWADQSGCVLRLDMRYCQKRSHIYPPRIFVCRVVLPTLQPWSIAGGLKCLEGVGTSPFNAGMLDQSLTKPSALPVTHSGVCSWWQTEKQFIHARNITSLMSKTCTHLKLNAAE